MSGSDALQGQEWGIRDIDDEGPPGVWLDTSRKRPHNTYLDLEKALAGKKKKTKLSLHSKSPPQSHLATKRLACTMTKQPTFLYL